MTIRLLRSIILLSVVCLSASGGCASRHSSQLPAVTLIYLHDEMIEISIRSSDSNPLTIDKRFALSGLAGGGNVSFTPVDNKGILHKVCSYIDVPLDYSEPLILKPSEESSENVVSINVLRKIHCLPAGEYSLSALYFDSRGNQFLSNTIRISIDEQGAEAEVSPSFTSGS